LPYSTPSQNYATEDGEKLRNIFSPILRVYQGLTYSIYRAAESLKTLFVPALMASTALLDSKKKNRSLIRVIIAHFMRCARHLEQNTQIMAASTVQDTARPGPVGAHCDHHLRSVLPHISTDLLLRILPGWKPRVLLTKS